MYKLNHKVESEHPFFRPHFTSKHSVWKPLIRMQHLTSSNNETIALYMFPEIPKSDSFLNKMPLSIESYALRKSIKATKVDNFFSFLVSTIDVSDDI